MAEEKVYKPETIEEIPLPQQSDDPFTVSSSGGTNDTYKPQTVPDQQLPRKVVAQETIGSSLNTKARKIQGEYSFTEHGAIAIGKHQPGVSGDIRITPEGFIARNKAGDPTVTIDAETGDATFKGTVQAGDVTVVDEQGLVSLSSFQSDTVVKETSTFRTDINWGDVPELVLQVKLNRPAVAILLATLSGRNFSDVSRQGTQSIRFDINGVPTSAWDLSGSDNPDSLTKNVITTTIHHFAQLKAGQNTLKVQHRWGVVSSASILGSGVSDTPGSSFSYIILGR